MVFAALFAVGCAPASHEARTSDASGVVSRVVPSSLPEQSSVATSDQLAAKSESSESPDSSDSNESKAAEHSTTADPLPVVGLPEVSGLQYQKQLSAAGFKKPVVTEIQFPLRSDAHARFTHELVTPVLVVF
ncbi:MAG: hypothetical protein HY074_11830, partial [Deltaproteobacteria bacterium]|nr:hypothetical protein [Deltaproteobacteria bacterium]